jgi:hypothetical protein
MMSHVDVLVVPGTGALETKLIPRRERYWKA